ncbi:MULTISPECIES: anhydro-N-acetylmuramic acid kinase [unclassified Photobacterium]|uniref:anhydro-N-acetylmuramic acid kinase n=1 Tax=unclassified Photobacterium TaxID=2628852 RepID=UPI001EDD4994|nr:MULTISPECIES: anhydro-N-acetylmuramic acid kinase [unclassified Photobacterium]MCG3865508.1 anhydro-N-acetylmuramic acid kinase [Photobacterium sp. Ph6]MCG3877013.1 anhydro-N-acetylmuramic acid kinase [Photobacterium sp. Ph5]
MEKYIGLMSGTSMDGVDAVLVEIDDTKITLLGSYDHPMPSDLKQALLDVCIGQATNLLAIGELDHRLGCLFADAVNGLLEKTATSAESIKAVASHGQTVFHAPDSPYPFTMQLGDANIIAAKTGITTVADFRRKDMAFGGQGAPLVPAFHQQLFSDKNINRVILNIGGISNITVLTPNKPVIGFDTGAGNMLMDAWINLHLQQSYDKNAQWALSGTVNVELLANLLSEPYLSLCAPKSTGRELFNLPWLEQHLAGLTIKPEDVQATLAEYTAVTIANDVRQTAQDTPDNMPNELLVCGGGAHNPLIMRRLTQLLTDWTVTITNERGVDSDNMEAMAFAWLGYRTLHGLSGNLPEVTGASRLTTLGAIYPAE